MSSIDSDGYFQPSDDESSSCKTEELEARAKLDQHLQNFQQALVNWHAGNGSQYETVIHCVVPLQLIRQKQEIESQIQQQIKKQAALNQTVVELNNTIHQLQSQIEAAEQTTATIEKAKSGEELQRANKQMEQTISKLSQLENNSQIKIKTETLDQQNERKKRSQATMLALYQKKMKQDQLQSERYNRMRRELEKKIEEEEQLGHFTDSQRRAAKDNKLIADRVSQLENSIMLLKRVLGTE